MILDSYHRFWQWCIFWGVFIGLLFAMFISFAKAETAMCFSQDDTYRLTYEYKKCMVEREAIQIMTNMNIELEKQKQSFENEVNLLRGQIDSTNTIAENYKGMYEKCESGRSWEKKLTVGGIILIIIGGVALLL